MMRQILVVIIVMLVCRTAAVLADPTANLIRMRVIIRPANGEIVSPHCGTDIQKHVWRIVMKRPYIEILDGQMAVRIDQKQPTPVQRQQVGARTFVGFYDLDETRTIAFGIRWRDARGRHVPVEISVIEQATAADHAEVCRETWLGLGERI